MPDALPDIAEFGVIGDRHTAALIDRCGQVLWYCPGRFDRPSLLAGLLDSERGGRWAPRLPEASFADRHYLEDSGILRTRLTTPAGDLTFTDWMPMGRDLPRGICRQISRAPGDMVLTLQPAPDYGRRPLRVRRQGAAVAIDEAHYLYASHPLDVQDGEVLFTLPAGQSGWACLLDDSSFDPSAAELDTWREASLATWREVASHATYKGPYEQQVANSIRALRLLTYEENGAIIAAPTTSLPEELGGRRNYDYRYVWLRDAGMITSALTRAGSDGTEERRFLTFICDSRRDIDGMPLAPFYTLDGELPLPEEPLPLTGYGGSRPVQIGNGAYSQLQFGGYGNVLLAAKIIYERFGTREHWSIIERLADYLAMHWREPDYGIWEEPEPRQYTTSKVIAAVGLEFIAEHAEDEDQAQRWRQAAAAIRRYVADECLNAKGAYAAVAGGEAVDISAALYPVWAYTEPDTPEMLATIEALERGYADGHLYRRHLERYDSKQEGAFLAGTLWMAQYWIMRDVEQARTILEAVLQYANDLGFFAEEVDPETGQMLGNFPQTFVHASFIGAVHDLKDVLQEPQEE